jgi:quinol monooxygenase YgiN
VQAVSYELESEGLWFPRATRSDIVMPSENDRPVTLINVFTVEPAHQRRLIDLLTEATERSVRYAPGFISARLHRSLDGTKVTMYAEWRSIADYEAMRADPGPLPYLQQALAIAKFEPGMYEVVSTFAPAMRRT